MILASNIQRYEGLPFETYLSESEGYSHSFLKYQRFGIVEQKEVTDNMRVGSLVDAILTEPHKVDMRDPLYRSAKQIAYDLKNKYGDMILAFKKQVSVSGVFELNGFQLKTKGRLDFLLENVAVIDLKVTWSKNVVELINYMGYKNQVFGYAKLVGVAKAYIMIHSVPLKKTFVYEIPIGDTNEFWEDAIMNFGTVK